MELLTVREREILKTLRKVDSVGLASLRLGIKTKTIYNVLYRIRRKYLEARKFVNTIEAYRKDPFLKELLTPRRKLTPKEEREIKIEEEHEE